jgi:hypothetical protein
MEADSRSDMANDLRNLARRIECDQVTSGVWGSYSSGAIYELLIDPEQTHDIYHAALVKYLDKLKSMTPTDQPKP